LPKARRWGRVSWVQLIVEVADVLEVVYMRIRPAEVRVITRSDGPEFL